mgnify:CR=1 FL=1
MTTTDNLGLNLPESNDYADVAVLNQNFQKLDAQALKAQTAKTAPADAVKVPVIDSADASKTKLVLWSAIKTALSSVFAGITHAARHKTGGADALAPADIGAAAASHNHIKSQITDFPTSMTPTAHKSTHAVGGSDVLKSTDLGIDATTAAKFFASVTGAETVDQVLSLLGPFHRGLGNEYVWEKTITEFQETVTSLGTTKIDNGGLGADNRTIYYASSYTVSNGKYVLTNYSSLTFNPNNTLSSVSAIKGKYVQNQSGDFALNSSGMYFVPSDAAISTTTETVSGSSYVYATVSKCTSYQNPHNITTSYGYVNSHDSGAYPPAESDGYTYTPLGQIGSKVQIATGFYTGTGTYGSGNKNSLTFPFVPKLIYITASTMTNGYGQTITQSNWKLWHTGLANAYVGYSGDYAQDTYSVNNKTFSWYNDTNSTQQLNYSGQQYHYTAIG